VDETTSFGPREADVRATDEGGVIMDHEGAAPLDLEWYRKQAKGLVRAWRAGDRDATERVERALGERAKRRFALSDAQWVIANEHGCRSWAELRRSVSEPAVRVGIGAAFVAAAAAWPERGEALLDSGLTYGGTAPVVVRASKRERRYLFTDDGRALEAAGRPPGWRDSGRRLELDYSVNVSRSGAVFLPAVHRRGEEWLASIAERVAEASAAFYGDLLELDEPLHSDG
jgi:hypothetical protein